MAKTARFTGLMLAALLAGCVSQAPQAAPPAPVEPAPPLLAWSAFTYLENGTSIVSLGAANSNLSRPAIVVYDEASGQVISSPDPIGGQPFSGFAIPEQPASARVFLAPRRSDGPDVFLEFYANLTEALAATPIPPVKQRYALQYAHREPDGSWRIEKIVDGLLGPEGAPGDARSGVLHARTAFLTSDGEPAIMVTRVADFSTVLLDRHEGAWRRTTLERMVFQDVWTDFSGSLHLCGVDASAELGSVLYARGTIGGPWEVDRIDRPPGFLSCEVVIDDEGQPHVLYDGDSAGSLPLVPRERRLWHAWWDGTRWQRETLPVPGTTTMPQFSATWSAGALWVGVPLSDRAALLCRCNDSWSDQSPAEFESLPRTPLLVPGPEKPHVAMDAGVVMLWVWGQAGRPDVQPGPQPFSAPPV